MNKKSEFLFYSFFIVIALFFIEVGYLYTTKGIDKNALGTKREFVELLKLPDLAISTEASYVRHRSLSDFFSIYRDDGALREYFASTFVFSSNDKSRDEK
ncbi:MAG: hypothetical protein C0628_01610 [Sulfurimonas sp.]|jgi:hypothetical protein|nr:MAG: hypothetical protein C0628_01610 [Sulfurimonas sp.]